MWDTHGLNLLRLGLNVRRRRHHMCMTQAALAEKLSCSVSKVSGIEHGRRNISVVTLLALCRALEWTLPELLSGVD